MSPRLLILSLVLLASSCASVAAIGGAPPWQVLPDDDPPRPASEVPS